MGRRLVVGADGARNQTLLLLLALAPLSAQAFDGSLSVELSGGNKTFAGSLIGDWGVVPDHLYLVASYALVKQRIDDPAVTAQASHLFGLGLDWSPSMHWLASLNLSFSPKATDTDTITENIAVTSSRRSASFIAAAGYQSAGLGAFEWAVDVGALGAWYELTTHGRFFRMNYDEVGNLFVARPSLGLTFTLAGSNDLGLRGSYSIYSSDPAEAGGLPAEFGQNIRNATLKEAALALAQRADATASYSSAPVWFDAKVTFARRFGARVTGRLTYTFVRYVHGLGNQHVLSTKWTVKLTGWLKLWAAATLQYDQLSTEPGFGSGYGTLGGEVATE